MKYNTVIYGRGICICLHDILHSLMTITSQRTSRTFSLSPLTMSSSCAKNSGMSHVQLMYRPLSHCRFSAVR